MKKILSYILMLVLVFSLVGCTSQAPENNEGASNQDAQEKIVNEEVILATTTSTRDSGLLDEIVPVFEEETGYKVKIIAIGTGKALAMGEKGDADVLLTHAPSSEAKLVKNNDMINYKMVMHNDFVIVGPSDDPAQIKGLETAAEAFKKISETESLLVSRGDDSGTNKKELAIWKNAGIEPAGTWYQESGSGMGQTINITSEKDGYTITDRATYLALKENLNLDILVEGEATLLNIYHVGQVNPEKSDLINAEGAESFVDFMISDSTQKMIGEFGVDKYGTPLFFPDADKDPSVYGLEY